MHELPGGGRTNDAPAAVGLADGSVKVFVRTLDDTLYQNRRDWYTHEWSGWYPVPGAPAIASNPGVAYYGDRLWVVVRDHGGRIFMAHQGTNVVVGGGGEYWTPFTEVLGGGRTDVAPAVAASSSGVYIVVRALDGAIYMKTPSTPNSWIPVPGEGRTPSAPAAFIPNVGTNPGSTLYVAVRGTDNRIYLNTRNATTGAWSLWYEVPGDGRTGTAPALSFSQAHVNLFVTGTDNKIHHNPNI